MNGIWKVFVDKKKIYIYIFATLVRNEARHLDDKASSL